MPHQLKKLTPNLIVANVERSLAGVRDAHAALKGRVKVVMPLEKKWYGVTEFAFEDPDGYLITFAEREQAAR